MTNVHSIDLEIELLTDVCISSSNRTLGDPDVANCIPGRVLWGAAANYAYRSGMSEAEAFRLYHQGAVRILDATPICDNSRCYPAPRSWHHRKDGTDSAFHNFALNSVRLQARDAQFKPVKDMWLSVNLTSVRVETSYSLRTSVDPTGKARDGLLFGLPSIRAGTRFCTTVMGQDAADVEKTVQHLVSQDLRLGRSRNSELGLARCTRRQQALEVLHQNSSMEQCMSFLCVSRCLLRDPRTGSPTLVPVAETFGLEREWQYHEASSFIRTARIVHFNAKRQRPEPERFALERGSVVTFASQGKVSGFPDLSGGVGEHCGQGYGEVLVAPTWLTAAQHTVTPSGGQAKITGPEPSDEFFLWAKRQAELRSSSVTLYETAHRAAKDFRRYNLPPSQWGSLHRMAREARFRQNERLMEDLKKLLQSGKRRLSSDWQKAEPSLLALCQDKGKELPMFLEHLAGACMRPDGGDV